MKNKIVLMLATFAILSIVFLPRSHDTKSQRKARLIPIPLEKASNQSIADTDNGPKTKLLERVQDKSSLPFQVTHFSRHFTDKKSSESVVVMTAGGASRFSIASDFAFPHALNTLRGAEEIARTRWVQELASIMMTWPDNRTVMVVSGNTEFQQPLLNWIISAVLKANVSLDRILILAADESLYEVLKERRVESVFVPPTSLYDTKIHQLGIHKLITFARFAVVRLLNYWGFTVAHYDSDALILRDTQRIYENYPLSSIVASKGAGPRSLCAGSVLFRSGRQIEEYWMQASKWKGGNDQNMINEVLRSLSVELHYHQENDAVDGECLTNDMKITILPSEVMCRRKCSTNLLDQVYVWHPQTVGKGNGMDVIRTLAKEGLAYVSHDWTNRCESRSIVGEDWLQCVASH